LRRFNRNNRNNNRDRKVMSAEKTAPVEEAKPEKKSWWKKLIG